MDGELRAEVDDRAARLEEVRREAADVRDRTRRLRGRLVVRLALLLVALLRRPWRLPALLRDARRPADGDVRRDPPDVAHRDAADGAHRDAAPDRAGTAAGGGLRLTRPARRSAHPHLRVAHLGGVAGLADVVPHVELDDDWRAQLDEGADLLLVDPPLHAGPIAAISSACGARGVPRVVVARYLDDLAVLDGAGEVELAVAEDPAVTAAATDRLGAERVLEVDPAIDPRRLNPVGWEREPRRVAMVAVTAAGVGGSSEGLDGLDALIEPFGDALTVVVTPEIDPEALPAGLRGRPTEVVRDAAAFADVVRDHRLAICHPGLHPSQGAYLRHALATVACGTPILHPPDPRLSRLLPDRALHPAGSPADAADHATDLADATTRERRSIVGRRHVLLHHTVDRRFEALLDRLGFVRPPEPTISVLLATHRPGSLDHAHDQIARQSYPHLEIITVCHGEGFDRSHLDRLAARHPHPTRALHAPAHWPLGAVLNLGLDHATGELVTKMDDDDHYGPDHLADLLAALRYSGADVVGKLPNFIYLSGSDLTISRYLEHEERPVWHLPGATILTHRETLAAFRFSHVPRAVDTHLYRRLHRADGQRYSTHRYNFVRFRGTEHTYDKPEREFLEQAEERHPGLAEHVTMTPPARVTDDVGGAVVGPTDASDVTGPASSAPRRSASRGAERLDGRWPPPVLDELDRRLEAARRDLARARHELKRLRARRVVRVALLAAETLRRPWRAWRLPAGIRDALEPVDVGDPPPAHGTGSPTGPGGPGDDAGLALTPAGQRPRYPHLLVGHLGQPTVSRGMARHVDLRGDGWVEHLEEGGADILVLDPSAGDAGSSGDVVGACRDRGIPVVLLARETADLGVVDADRVTLVVADDPDVAAHVADDRLLLVDTVVDHPDRRERRFDAILERLGMPTAPTPTVSVLVRVDDADGMDALHTWVGSQSHPSLEVVVLRDDTMSDEGSPVRGHPHPTRVVDVPADLPVGDALNLGLDHATGVLVAIVDPAVMWDPRDPDPDPDPDHLTGLLRGLRGSQADLAVATTPGGGTSLLVHRETLRALRFRRTAADVVGDLAARVRDAGGHVYELGR